MKKGVIVHALFLALAACSTQQSSVPRGAENWPAEKRIQRLPQAQALPKATPQWTMRPVVADAVDVAEQSYVVKAGDTLRRISDQAGASSEAIARANNIEAPFVIRVGQRLRIPGGRYHSVKSGETGITIARAYGVSWGRVIDANGLTEPYILRIGQKLLLPTSREIAAMSMEDRARAFRLNIDDLITGSAPAEPEQTATSTPPPSVSKPAPQPAAPPAALGNFAWPAKGRILSSFGPKSGGRFNDGINIQLARGTTIRAAGDGVVAYADSTLPGFGGLVLIKHEANWVTAYAHADALLVTRGQKVKKGDAIARAGSTGSVDEPQLHFEIRQGRRPVDPIKQLPPQ